MTLNQAELEAPSRVTGFCGMAEADEARLTAHGLCAGVQVTKLMLTPLRDPVECLVGTQLLALDTELMKKILVEPA